MAYYAAHNTRTDLNNSNHGCRNAWKVSRFDTKAERDNFVERYENKDARPVTRKQAAEIFADRYLSVGVRVPVGGLFAQNPNEVFWNYFWDTNA